MSKGNLTTKQKIRNFSELETSLLNTKCPVSLLNWVCGLFLFFFFKPFTPLSPFEFQQFRANGASVRGKLAITSLSPDEQTAVRDLPAETNMLPRGGNASGLCQEQQSCSPLRSARDIVV